MDSNFWVKRWTEGQIGFHQSVYHEKLRQYFPQLNAQKEQSVLVPMCGKTRDLAWLDQFGLRVHGVELFEKAAEAFFTENEFPAPRKTRDQDFTHYSSGNVTVSCGDFFKLERKEKYDFVYDRAALVALPRPMRMDYAEVIRQVLKKGGKSLLITYEYDQALMDGPPFSVDEAEVHELFQNAFTIRRMESEKPANEGPRLSALQDFRQVVYILEKKDK